MNQIVLPTACVLLMFAVSGSVRSELPPDAYPNPNSASEIVEVKVLSSTSRYQPLGGLATSFDVDVVAEVIAVNRSMAGLTPGSKIEIRYYHRGTPLLTPGWCGPGSFEILKSGTIVKAHLIPSDRSGLWMPVTTAVNRIRYSHQLRGVFEPYGAPSNALTTVAE